MCLIKSLQFFHNDWKYDQHLIIKKLENQFDGQFQCIGENNELYKSFSVPIKKEVIKIDKDGKRSDEITSDKIEFIDSPRFMTSSLSNLVDNLSEKIHKIIKSIKTLRKHQEQFNKI